MYVLVRRDLKPQQQMVQAIHAVAEYCIHHPDTSKEWNNHTLVVLGVKDLEELEYWLDRCWEEDVVYNCFYESHYDQITAGAAIDTDDKLKKLFDRLDLL